MTKEYREYAKSRIEYLLKISRLDERDKEALEAAIQALSQEPTIGQLFSCEEVEELRSKIWKQVEQEPCEDAISRDAVLDAIEREDKWLLAAKGHNGLTEIAFSGLKARVDALPSVTPKSKTGHWIDYSDEGYVECPFCGHATNCEDNIDELHYCFYCGARMESEE